MPGMQQELQSVRSERSGKLAADVLRLSFNVLLLNLRYMDAALSKLVHVPMLLPDAPLATEGEHLFFDDLSVLRAYKQERARPVRDCLHTVLHCVFAHPFADSKLDGDLWDLACDIAVENVINEMGLRQASCTREHKQQRLLGQLAGEVKHMTAEAIYRYYLDAGFDKVRIAEDRALFIADSHHLWRHWQDQAAGDGESQDADEGFEGECDLIPAEGQQQGTSAQMRMTDFRFGSNEALERKWEDIARHMKTDLQTFSSDAGTSSGAMMQALGLVTREKYDYEAFLRQFAASGEAVTVNPDEFDYIFYSYGLQHYGRMPLVEPLEYKEVNRIKEFVIAIDTSGSVSGDLVQRFVQKTYDILQNEESFFKKLNVHIIQCDAEIQEDVKVTSRQDFDEYLQSMKLRGFGGTDFRPVFDYVERLRKDGELTNLKGLIYFTDGYGTFPERKTDYKTAFCFVAQEGEGVRVPPWAYKLVLDDEEI